MYESASEPEIDILTGLTRDDLNYGDMTLNEVKELGYFFESIDNPDSSDDEFFSAINGLLEKLATGKIDSVVDALVEHMKGNSGKYFRNYHLTNTVRNHENTIDILNKVETRINTQGSGMVFTA